jgi:hypothetical protein
MTPPRDPKSESELDRYAVACNYREGTGVARQGAKAFLADWHWTGGGWERVRVVARSRGGRHVTKWEPVKRLTNFRSTTVPPEHPMYKHQDVGFHETREKADEFAERLTRISPPSESASAKPRP